MNNFTKALGKKLIHSQFNYFGANNYDELRFGKLNHIKEPSPSLYIQLKRVLIEIIGYKKNQKLSRHKEFVTKYEAGLQRIYDNLTHKEQKLLVDLIAYRLLDYKHVKLGRNNKEYWDALETANSLADWNDTYDPHFLHFILQKFDLKKIGYDIKLYFSVLGIAIDFIFEQYSYKSLIKSNVSVEEGDVVLDLGACWGDTALYFASKAGKQGKVYSFEFIPGNLKLFNINIALNPNLTKHIELIQHPVSNKSGDKVYFIDNGPGSRIEYESFNGYTGFTTTISLDDFVKNNGITKVDFIKMDIEGAEFYALTGAIETIKRFKPKLAIAIYHTMDDFINIPYWILKLNLGYKISLGHYTIHSEETVIFAKVE